MSQAHGCHASNYRQLAVGFAYAAAVSHGASAVPMLRRRRCLTQHHVTACIRVGAASWARPAG